MFVLRRAVVCVVETCPKTSGVTANNREKPQASANVRNFLLSLLFIVSSFSVYAKCNRAFREAALCRVINLMGVKNRNQNRGKNQTGLVTIVHRKEDEQLRPVELAIQPKPLTHCCWRK
jgi:hypothetical protein